MKAPECEAGSELRPLLGSPQLFTTHCGGRYKYLSVPPCALQSCPLLPRAPAASTTPSSLPHPDRRLWGEWSLWRDTEALMTSTEVAWDVAGNPGCTSHRGMSHPPLVSMLVVMQPPGGRKKGNFFKIEIYEHILEWYQN